MRKLFSLFIILLLVFTLCACGNTAEEAPAATELSESPEISLGTRSLGASGGAGMLSGSDVLRTDAGRDGAQIVWYGGHNWYVIGYDGEGNAVAAKEDAVTLLHVTAEDQAPFSDVSGNTYRGSDLENYLESMLAGGSRAIFTTSEQKAVISRKIEGGSANRGEDGYDDNKVKGESVTVPLWPLSAAEEKEIPSSIATVGIGSTWWLRSPGNSDANVQTVGGDGAVSTDGTDAAQKGGIRPAFDLDPDAVLFTSSAEGGKNSGSVGPDALIFVESNMSGEWKLTLKDDGSVPGLSGHAGFSVGTVTTCDGKTINIEYSGAATGSGEYISAVITDPSGAVIYYGRIAECTSSSGSVTLHVDGLLCDGDTLSLFNEKYNGDKQTDYASVLKTVSIPSDADHVWKEATCTEPKTCTVCGITEGDPHGHDWADATCTEPKTCRTCGITEGEPLGHDWVSTSCTEPRTCSVCGETESEAPGHDWVDATCTEPKTCRVCGATEGDPLGHDWKDATCTEPKTCRVCQATEGEPLGHKPGAEVRENEKAATCDEKGSYDSVVTCEVCHEEISRETKETEVLGHSWDEGKVTKEPTCEEKGEKTYTCKNDPSHTKKEEIKELGHDWDEGRITKEPTCETKGEKTYTCKHDSSHTKKEEIMELGHDWDEGKITKEATCEEKGEKTYTCKNDSAHTKKEEVKELGHDWGEWIVTKEPTTEAKGERERVCSRCEKKETEEIDALKGYKVTFDTRGGSAVAAQTVAENKTATKPKDPVRDGYTFTGWFADSECKTAFDFKTAVKADITVYAGWKENEKGVYTIVEGADGTWEKGSGKSYTIRIRRSEDDAKCFDHYKETLVDGKTMTVYAASGSTVVILSPDSLEKLSVGAHTINIRFDDSEAVAYLTVKDAPVPVEPDEPDEPDEPEDTEPPEDEPDVPDTPDEPDAPDTPDETEPEDPDKPVPDDGDDTVGPIVPDDSGKGEKKGSPLLWLIAIPVVLIGGGAGYLLMRNRTRK